MVVGTDTGDCVFSIELFLMEHDAVTAWLFSYSTTRLYIAAIYEFHFVPQASVNEP